VPRSVAVVMWRLEVNPNHIPNSTVPGASDVDLNALRPQPYLFWASNYDFDEVKVVLLS
jgi:hypothetical protein